MTAGERKRVLICDDDPLLLDLVRHRLSSRGYEVEVAEDGAEALSSIEISPPDAVVLDAMMPVVDGYELLRRLRARPETAAIPVIMLTARRQEEDVLSALQLGADDYMVKPFIPEELVVRLGRLLDGEPR